MFTELGERITNCKGYTQCKVPKFPDCYSLTPYNKTPCHQQENQKGVRTKVGLTQCIALARTRETTTWPTLPKKTKVWPLQPLA